MIKIRANPVYYGIDTTDLAWTGKLIQAIAGGPNCQAADPRAAAFANAREVGVAMSVAAAS
jgi:hypothetical protein